MTNMSNKFEADTGKILDIVINSLYSEREIFLRELVSNASDALDKRKYLGLTDKNINNSSDVSEIKDLSDDHFSVHGRVPHLFFSLIPCPY